MLSKTELEFLRSPESFSPSYAKVLRSRVKSKTKAFNEERALMAKAGLVTENCNRVTETCNLKISLNQADSLNQNVILAGPTGIEPATYGLRVRRSSLTEPRARMASLLKEVPLNNIELTVCCCSVMQ